jgi:hypothetical protein
MVTNFVVQFGNERSCADSSQVGLRYTNDLVDRPGADTGTNEGVPRDWVGRRYERIRPVVEIKKRGLSPFEENTLPGVQSLVKVANGIADIWGDAGRYFVN